MKYIVKKLIVIEDFGDLTFDKIFHRKDIYNLLKLAIDNLIIIKIHYFRLFRKIRKIYIQ